MKLVLQIAAGIVLGFVLLGFLISFATMTPGDGYQAGRSIGRFIGSALVFVVPAALILGLIYTGYRAFIAPSRRDPPSARR